jgi:hypothetical protein
LPYLISYINLATIADYKAIINNKDKILNLLY